MGVTVRDKDAGYRKMIAALDASTKPYVVTVGVHEEEGAEPDGDEEGALTVIEVAELNEFGSPGGLIPSRSFVGAWADEHEGEVTRQLKDETAKALRAGKSPALRADQLAQRYAGDIQKRIAGGIPPENKRSTVLKKGSSTPLIGISGTLRASIRGKVEAK